MLRKTVSINPEKKIVVMFGPLASGKGTQAKKIASAFNIPQISIGDILRENVKNETELGKIAKSVMEKGQLVSDNLIIDLLKDRISNSDCNKGFILDGYPRTKPQAKALIEMAKEQKFDINNVVLLDISLDLAIKRATGRWVCKDCGGDINTAYNEDFNKRVEKAKDNNQIVTHNKNGCTSEMVQRADDTVDSIKNRFEDFVTNTKPAFNELANIYPNLIVEGSQTIDTIFQKITDFVSSKVTV